MFIPAARKPNSVPPATSAGGRPFLWAVRCRAARATYPRIVRRLRRRLCRPGPGLSAYLVLLPVGFAVPPVSPRTRCALYRTISPLPFDSLTLAQGGPGACLERAKASRKAVSFCCTFRRVAPPGRYPAPCPVQFGLSSPAFRPFGRRAGAIAAAAGTIRVIPDLPTGGSPGEDLPRKRRARRISKVRGEGEDCRDVRPNLFCPGVRRGGRVRVDRGGVLRLFDVRDAGTRASAGWSRALRRCRGSTWPSSTRRFLACSSARRWRRSVRWWRAALPGDGRARGGWWRAGCSTCWERFSSPWRATCR